MNIVCVIPARQGSSLKDKNIYPLGGYPLLAWAIGCASMSCHIKRTFVYTDSDKYGEIAQQFGVNWLLDDNPLIGKVPNHVFLKSFLEKYDSFNGSLGKPIDYLVILWATTPLRDAEYVDKAITGFLVSKATSLKSVVQMSESAYKAMKLDSSGYLISLEGDLSNVPRQQIPKTYHPNGYVDIMRVDLLREGRGWGDKILPFLCDDVGEIDTLQDIKQIERLHKEGVGSTTHEWLRNYVPFEYV